ncbi:MAG: hypothetical protein GY696_16330, partial [Gammaproteobacteria bacterium]|nr:hypothetical protein [Gammaproteobacteria bacterium]
MMDEFEDPQARGIPENQGGHEPTGLDNEIGNIITPTDYGITFITLIPTSDNDEDGEYIFPVPKQQKENGLDAETSDAISGPVREVEPAPP